MEAESVQRPVALTLYDGVVMMLGEKTSLVDDFGVGKKGRLYESSVCWGYLQPEHGLELFTLHFDIAWRLGNTM